MTEITIQIPDSMLDVMIGPHCSIRTGAPTVPRFIAALRSTIDTAVAVAQSDAEANPRHDAAMREIWARLAKINVEPDRLTHRRRRGADTGELVNGTEIGFGFIDGERRDP